MNSAAQMWVFVAIAGGAGTLARYALGGWLSRATGGGFPWGTLAINVGGSLAIGIIAAALDRGSSLPPGLRIALIVGFLGGFTTFSAFALETLRLGESAQWQSAILYVGLTNVGGLAAAWLGYRLTVGA